MKITKITIQNYRLLKNFNLDINEDLSLVIGKNNTGKTSILTVLEKFLNQSENKFTSDDLNIDFKNRLKEIITGDEITNENYKDEGIKLRIYIKYDEKDDLSNISRLMMDLSPDNNYIVLGFELVLKYKLYLQFRKEFQEFQLKEQGKLSPNYSPKDFNYFVKQNLTEYFKLSRKSIEYIPETNETNETNFIDLDAEKISTKEVINFRFVSAKRDVTNKEIDKTLSRQTSLIYQKSETDENQKEKIEEFKDQLATTDNVLSGIYTDLFGSIISKISTLGGIKPNDSIIEIISTLQHRELLEGNTTVMYSHDDENLLPENYNGLGYMNLISIIFQIEILIHDFRRNGNDKPADINLLFIEEPEAHTHPQMQYVFIKNIKTLLAGGIVKTIKAEAGNEIKIKKELQYIITTHSPHIVSETDFDDIKYVRVKDKNEVEAKNLKDLEKEYTKDGEENNYRFLKQYLTLNRAELFFADKAIFIEGDTERILLPAMMKKIDQEYPENPMLSQNISTIEVGAYSQIFEKFIDFIGLKKGLIITDLDGYYLVPEFEPDNITQKTYQNGNPKFEVVKCAASNANAQYTSNYSLIFFHSQQKDLGYYNSLNKEQKILSKNSKKEWVVNKDGNLFTCYQIDESGYIPRSFEDSFFIINKGFITDTNNTFSSLTQKYLKKYRIDEISSFEFGEKAVNSKPSLSIEILMNSKADKNGNEYTNWEIPAYIKEGLLWLKED